MSGEKKQKRRSKTTRVVRSLFFRLVLLGALLTLIAGAALWAKSVILARQVKTTAVMEGTLEVPLEIQALTINSEQVVTSGLTGRIDKLAAEGERVRRGASVARVIAQANSQGRLELTSPSSGIVSYLVDGLEGILTPKNLSDWNLDRFKNLTPNTSNGETVQGGQGAFKVIDNLLPTYLLFNLPRDGVSLAPGDKVSLLLENQKLSAKVLKINTQGPQEGVAVALPAFLPQSTGQRVLKLSWLDKNPAKGIIIPLSALVERQGKSGVYLLLEGTVSWKEINILAQTKDKACVSGINSGSVLVVTPAYVKEGQILNISY